MILNSTTTCSGTASGTTCTTLYAPDPSSTAATANGFTYGEIIISMMLFLILLCGITIVYHLKFRTTKTK